MGFRYRKSINLGGGFRINISKSGIGYSWGVKGYRRTKTSRGTKRTTFSIPGTGISFVNESKKSKTKEKSRHQNSTNNHNPPINRINNNYYNSEEIKNIINTDTSNDIYKDMIALATRNLKLNHISNIGLIVTLILGIAFPFFLVVLFLFIVFKIYIKTNGNIELDFSIDDNQQIYERTNKILKISDCSKIWRVTQTSKVIDKKYAAGAEDVIKRVNCKVSKKAVFPFKTNIPVLSLKANNETLVFLPDKLFIIQGNKINVLDYFDISFSSDKTHFIEDKSVPKDSKIVDYTWKYVNKSGSPDKRFKDNKKIPICLYGILSLNSDKGLNTIIMFSNPDVDVNIN